MRKKGQFPKRISFDRNCYNKRRATWRVTLTKWERWADDIHMQRNYSNMRKAGFFGFFVPFDMIPLDSSTFHRPLCCLFHSPTSPIIFILPPRQRHFTMIVWEYKKERKKSVSMLSTINTNIIITREMCVFAGIFDENRSASGNCRRFSLMSYNQ